MNYQLEPPPPVSPPPTPTQKCPEKTENSDYNLLTCDLNTYVLGTVWCIVPYATMILVYAQLELHDHINQWRKKLDITIL